MACALGRRVSAATSYAVAVFGSSEPPPGHPEYETARRVGALLAGAGCTVITGGYGGVMEGASRGALEAGGHTLGVACAIFTERRPNPYLSETLVAPELYTRTRELIERAQGYLVLHGQSGTLAELAQLWALGRAGCHAERPVVLLGHAFERLLEVLEETEMLDANQRRRTVVARTPEEAVSRLVPKLTRGAGH